MCVLGCCCDTLPTTCSHRHTQSFVWVHVCAQIRVSSTSLLVLKTWSFSWWFPCFYLWGNCLEMSEFCCQICHHCGLIWSHCTVNMIQTTGKYLSVAFGQPFTSSKSQIMLALAPTWPRCVVVIFRIVFSCLLSVKIKFYIGVLQDRTLTCGGSLSCEHTWFTRVDIDRTKDSQLNLIKTKLEKLFRLDCWNRKGNPKICELSYM